MSPQMQFLDTVIKRAQQDDDAAITLLRNICIEIVGTAPTHDLIGFGQYLLHLGRDLSKRQLEDQ